MDGDWAVRSTQRPRSESSKGTDRRNQRRDESAHVVERVVADYLVDDGLTMMNGSTRILATVL